MNKIEKKSFHLEKVELDCGQSIPVTLGYEAYGELNPEKSNVILISHYFSASSHAAGKYHPGEVISGYWDFLIGPGKAIDTNRFFVVSIDNLCNIQWKNPKVITTGPRSINPDTGKRWGSTFPPFTFRDMMKIQKTFLHYQWGIESIFAAIGASAGGFSAMEWAVNYPEQVEKLICVITNPQTPVQTSFSVCQQAMRAIALDPRWGNGNYEDGEEPEEGFLLAAQMMSVEAFTPMFYERMYARKLNEDIQEPLFFERKMTSDMKRNIRYMDASHWYYTCRATMLHDISRGYGSLEEALQKIQAQTLMISCVSDRLQPTVYNRRMVRLLNEMGKDARLIEIESEKGHMAGILETDLFSEDVRSFLKKE